MLRFGRAVLTVVEVAIAAFISADPVKRTVIASDQCHPRRDRDDRPRS